MGFASIGAAGLVPGCVTAGAAPGRTPTNPALETLGAQDPLNGGAAPVTIPWLDKNGSHNQMPGPGVELSNIFHFKGRIARANDFTGMGTGQDGERISFGLKSTVSPSCRARHPRTSRKPVGSYLNLFSGPSHRGGVPGLARLLCRAPYVAFMSDRCRWSEPDSSGAVASARAAGRSSISARTRGAIPSLRNRGHRRRHPGRVLRHRLPACAA